MICVYKCNVAYVSAQLALGSAGHALCSAVLMVRLSRP
jgi:hypothetical protein